MKLCNITKSYIRCNFIITHIYLVLYDKDEKNTSSFLQKNILSIYREIWKVGNDVNFKNIHFLGKLSLTTSVNIIV